MAKTGIATNDAETVKLWSEKVFRDIAKTSYLTRFMGSDAGSVCQVKTDLEKAQGDRIRFALIPRLASGGGVTEGQTLEGNEDKLTDYTYDLELTQLRKAVRDNGAMTRQRAMFDVSSEQEYALKTWTTEEIDRQAFLALETSPTKVFYGDGTSTATVTAGGKITTTLISKMKAWAETGGNRAQTPLQPVMVNGKKHYILLVHPEVGFDLKEDTKWQAAQQYGNVRGESNPLFTGALGMWDNVIVHTHENVGLVDTWGAGGNVHGAKCSFLGAQALVWGWGERPTFVMEDFDYKNEKGIGMNMIYGVGKPKFNSLDYGSMALYVACTDVTA